MSKHHDLKIKRCYWEERKLGNKPFEIRYNDRDFQKGDTVLLRSLYNETNAYTGDEELTEITYITSYQQSEGWVVMTLHEVSND